MPATLKEAKMLVRFVWLRQIITCRSCIIFFVDEKLIKKLTRVSSYILQEALVTCSIKMSLLTSWSFTSISAYIYCTNI